MRVRAAQLSQLGELLPEAQTQHTFWREPEMLVWDKEAHAMPFLPAPVWTQGAAHAAGGHCDGGAEEASEQDEDAAAQGQRARLPDGGPAHAADAHIFPAPDSTSPFLVSSLLLVRSGLRRPNVRLRSR